MAKTQKNQNSTDFFSEPIANKEHAEAQERNKEVMEEVAEEQAAQHNQEMEDADVKTTTVTDVHGQSLEVPAQPKGALYDEESRTHLVFAYGAWRYLSESAVRTVKLDKTSMLVLPKGSKVEFKPKKK